MKCYPVDSVVTELGSDGLPVYDRPYTSKDIRDVYKAFFSNGVFGDPSDALQVFAATGGMNVVVHPGKCVIQGCFGEETEERTLQVQAASGQDRIDTVVARLDLGLEARSIDLYIRTGSPAASPVRPSLTQTDEVYEIGLADVYLPGGATSISTARISDTRLDTTRCGIVAPFVTLKTDTYYEQLQAATNTAVQAYRDAISGTVAGDLQQSKLGLVATKETRLAKGTNLDSVRQPGCYMFDAADNIMTPFDSAEYDSGYLVVFRIPGYGKDELVPTQELRMIGAGGYAGQTCVRELSLSTGKWSGWRSRVEFPVNLDYFGTLAQVGITVSERAAPSTGTPGTLHVQML